MSINNELIEMFELSKSMEGFDNAYGILNDSNSTALERAAATVALLSASVDTVEKYDKTGALKFLGHSLGGFAFATAIAELVEDHKDGTATWDDYISTIGTISYAIPLPHTKILGAILTSYSLANDFGEYLAKEGALDPLFEMILHQPEVEITWNDWEFAANEAYVEEPSFANAEQITSPIVLDLEGNGIQTLGTDAQVNFDHNGDGFAERTGWVSPEDGLLAIDKNGNGTIDDGSELFGNNSKLANGELASNGFEALKEYDTNEDGTFDSFDDSFHMFRVWRDLNLDGVSQEFEMLTLEEAGISAISTEYSSTNDIQNGNTLGETASITYADGSRSVATDVWFNTNPTLTRATELLEVSAEVASLPNIKGYGLVTDLQQAMMANEELIKLVESFVYEPDSNIRSSIIDEIIYEWAGVTDVDPNSRNATKIYGHVMDARQLETLEAFTGKDYLGTWCWGERDPNPHGRAAPVLIAQYEEFKSYIDGQLMAQSHYKDIFDQIGVQFDSITKEFVPDTTEFEIYVASLISNGDLIKASEIYQTVKNLSIRSIGYDIVESNMDANDSIAPYLIDSIITGTDQADTLTGTSADELIHGNRGDDTLFGGAGNDHYEYNKGDGADWIYDSDGRDTINFGEGISLENISVARGLIDLTITIDSDEPLSNDEITLANVYDFDGSLREGVIENITFADGSSINFETLESMIENEGSEGEDHLFGSEQDDTLDGLEGNDHIYGGAGDDTYLIARGSGKDQIQEHSGIDRIKFASDIAPEEVQVLRTGVDGKDIVIRLLTKTGELTTDQITVVDAYLNNERTNNWLEELVFDIDGESRSFNISELSVSAEIGNSIYLMESDDLIEGSSSEDTIYGAGGDDKIHGLEGDDHLFGNSGNDTLSGDAGNDHLSGGKGNDTYLFSSGFGHDVIDNSEGGVDKILFDKSISARKVEITRLENDLHLSVSRGSDTITLSNYFNGDTLSDNAIQTIEFADGTLLDTTEIISSTQKTSQGDDLIQGLNGVDTIFSQAGNDHVRGGRGDDVIDGGNGNDTLFGDDGNDSMRGGNGADVMWGGSGDDSMHGGNESDTLDGGAGNDQLFGGNGKDTLNGGVNNDVLDGGNGNDTLIGGSGDDMLHGGEGNDTYIINTFDGNDLINDTSGNDTIKFEEDSENLWFSREGENLLIRNLKSNNTTTIENWDESTIDRLETTDGYADIADIRLIVQAMTSFDDGQEEESEAIELQNTLDIAWHRE